MKSSIWSILLTCSLHGAHAQPASSQPQNVQVADTAASSDDYDRTFTKVQIESTFPGGPGAWMQFLKAHFVYPKKAVRKNIEGTVIVQFIVGKDGSISDIEAISGPDLLRQAGIDIIKESPPWKPAIQNGRKVKSYKKQPFVFKLQD